MVRKHKERISQKFQSKYVLLHNICWFIIYFLISNVNFYNVRVSKLSDIQWISNANSQHPNLHVSVQHIFYIGDGDVVSCGGGVGEFKQHDIDISYWTEKKKTLCRNVFWIFRLVWCTIQIILTFAFRFVDFICLHRIRSFSLSCFVCKDQQTCSNISYKWV